MSLISLLSFVALAVTAPTPDATKILNDAENVRNPQGNYRAIIHLIDKQGQKVDTRTYDSAVKGGNLALVTFLTPVADKGTKVLMVDNDMWLHIPSSAKPIRIAPRQKLTGNAVYGDITRLSFVGNYTAKFLKADKLKGKKVNVLELAAIEGRPVTYDRVEYWVNAENSQPLKALYKTAAGKVLREGVFENYEMVQGLERPSKFVIVDFLQKKHVTELVFSDVKEADLPDILFEKQNFARD